MTSEARPENMNSTKLAASINSPPPATRPTSWEALQVCHFNTKYVMYITRKIKTWKTSSMDFLTPNQSFDLSENLKGRFARVPSQRKALLFGMAGGTCIGALRFISTRRKLLFI